MGGVGTRNLKKLIKRSRVIGVIGLIKNEKRAKNEISSFFQNRFIVAWWKLVRI